MVKVTWLPLPCVLKNALVFISSVPRLNLCPKGLGRLLLLSYPFYFACLLAFYCLNQKPLNSYLSVFAAFPYPESLVNTFCSSLGSTLLLIENTMIDPLHLWFITRPGCAWAPGGSPLTPFWPTSVILQKNDPRWISSYLEVFLFSNLMSTFHRWIPRLLFQHRKVANCVKQDKTT